MSYPLSAREDFTIGPGTFMTATPLEDVVKELMRQNGEMARTIPVLTEQLYRTQQTLCFVLNQLEAQRRPVFAAEFAAEIPVETLVASY